MKNKISIAMCTYNDELILARCLDSVKWADEIVIVDLESTDNTLQIARKYTKSIYTHKKVPYVEPVRNYSIEKAKNDWILVLDADEQIPTTLATKLQEISETETGASSVAIPRKNIIFGKWIEHTGWWPDYNIRFFKKGKVRWSDEIHVDPQTFGEKIHLEEKPENAIVHYNYQTISQFLKKMDGYSSVEANEIIQKGYKFNWIDLISKPFNEFLSRFFARGGYDDGLHGLILSFLQAFSLLVVYIKIWEINKFTEVNKDDFSRQMKQQWKKIAHDFNYWIFSEEINNIKKPLKKFYFRLKRKI